LFNKDKVCELKIVNIYKKKGDDFIEFQKIEKEEEEDMQYKHVWKWRNGGRAHI
jgi:hypothetical protein